MKFLSCNNFQNLWVNFVCFSSSDISAPLFQNHDIDKTISSFLQNYSSWYHLANIRISIRYIYNLISTVLDPLVVCYSYKFFIMELHSLCWISFLCIYSLCILSSLLKVIFLFMSKWMSFVKPSQLLRFHISRSLHLIVIKITILHTFFSYIK